MNAYERGFNDGEHASWCDRKQSRPRRILGEPLGEYQRGYSDGYRPRNLAWLLTEAPRKAWHERDDGGLGG
jgi:hypothetical protein